MSDYEKKVFEAKLAELREEFASDPKAAERFLHEANRWPVPTWESDPEAAARIGVKLEPVTVGG